MSVSDGLETRLRAVLDARYHHQHPFNLRMHEGTLTRSELQAWVRNRYYYQTRIPIKDGAIVDKSRDPRFRRDWGRRIEDHCGVTPGDGGLARWLELAEAVGLDRAEVESLRAIAPGVRHACDAYVAFVRSHDLLESVASSLTELYAGPLMERRIAAFERHYPFVGEAGLRYFRSRTLQAPRDAAQGLAFLRAHARTPDDEARCEAALVRKCEILWSFLDAVESLSRRPKLSRYAQLRDEGAEQRTLVVLPERAVALNPSGREILSLCDGERSIDAVAAELRRRHPDAERVETLAFEFLGEMERLGVVEVAPAP